MGGDGKKELIGLCENVFLCAETRFAEPRSFLRKERFSCFLRCAKRTKKHTGRSPATHDSKLCRKRFCKAFGGFCRNRFCLQNAGVKALNRCERVTVVQTQDWCFSEKELLYCKLTVGCCRWNLQLLVSFGAAGSWSFAALKLIFSLSVGFALTEKITFFANQKFSIQKAYEPPSKAALLHTKALHLHKPFLAVRKYFQFLQTKSFSFAQTFFIATKSNSFPPSAFHFNAP